MSVGESETDEIAQEEITPEEESGRNIAWGTLIAAAFMGLIIGGLAAWAFANIGGSAVLFLIGFVGGTYYLYQKPMPSAAIGTGLYISSGIAILTPILFYIPMMMGAEEGTAEGAGTFIGSMAGLVIWGFVFFLIAVVMFVLGYFLNRRAKKKLKARDGPTAA